MTAHSLRFTIGYEMEVQIVNRDGSLLVGPRMKSTWNELLARATKKLAATLKSPDCPKIVHDRFKGAKLRQIEKAEKRLSNVGISYLLNNKKKPLIIDSFGPDPNLSQITWILELVTPPCQTMEELQFWCSHLYDVALQSLPPKRFSIISTGFNPLEKEYRSGLTFGDHIHIGGFLSDRERIKAYNLLRNFVPHLIALSANSPFIDGSPSNVPKISEEDQKIRVLGGKCAKSLRLIHNKSQLGPCDVERYIPYLKRPNPADFDKAVGRGYPDNRMVDIFPFTHWNTIELRFFDCQLSTAQRMAIVSILQAICLKANRLGQIPEVSTKTILDNRDKAVEFGLLGTFLKDKALENSTFGMIYNENPITGKKNSRMFEAVQSLLVWLQPELNHLGLQEFLTPIYVSVFGTDNLVPPCGPADYLLYLYQLKYRENIDKIVLFLESLTQEYCTKSNRSDPIVQTFGKPELPDFESLQAIYTSEPEIPAEDQHIPFDAELVFGKKGPILAGKRIPLEINLKNLKNKMQFLKIHTKLFQGSSVLYSNLKEMSLKPSESSKFSPLTGVPVGTIKGKTLCYLQVLISDDNENILTLESAEFEVIGSPEVMIKLVSPPRVGKGHSLKISLVNSTPSIAQNFTLSVGLIIIETCQAVHLVKKLISIVKTKNISIPLPTPPKGETARIGVSISHKDKVIASQETENIPISLRPSARKPTSSRSPATVRGSQAVSSSSRRTPSTPSSPPPSSPPVRVPSARSSRTKPSSPRPSVSSRSSLKPSRPKSPVRQPSSSSKPTQKTRRSSSHSTVKNKPRTRSSSSVSTTKPMKPSSASTKTTKLEKRSSSTRSKTSSSPSAPPATSSAKFSATARVSPSMRSSSRSSSSQHTRPSETKRSQPQMKKRSTFPSTTTKKSSQKTQSIKSSHSTRSTTSRSVSPPRTSSQSLSTDRSSDQKKKIKVPSKDKASDKTKVRKINVKDHTVSRQRKKR